MDALQERIGKFFYKQGANLDGAVRHLKEEIEEFTIDKDPQELADIVVVAFSVAHLMKFDLMKLVEAKQTINEHRQWKSIDGYVKHKVLS